MNRFILSTKKVKDINYKHYKTIAVIDSGSQTTVNVETPKKIWDDIPGPVSLPFIGQLLHHTPHIGPLHLTNDFEKQKYLYEKYGPMVRLEGLNNKRDLYLFDPKDFIKVYRNEFFTPERASFASFTYYRNKYKKKEKEQKTSISLITEKGDNWRTLRSAINPLLMKRGALDSYEEMIGDVSEEMVSRLKNMRHDNNKINNIFIELSKAAVEAVTSVTFGYRINGLNASKDSPQSKIIEVVTSCLQVAEVLDMNPRYGLWEYFHTPTLYKAFKLYEEHDRLIEYFINEAAKNGAENNKENKLTSFFNQLNKKDKLNALGFASDTLFAGIFTVSSMITFILYHLAMNPGVQNKLRKEINKDKKDKYLKAVIKESMRITPITPRIKRTTTKDLTIGEYFIPKETVVTMCHYFASVQENQFPQPFEFIPERWLVDKDHFLHYGNADPYAFMPFGSGIRICIGKRFADMELEKFIKKIIENFQISWNSSEEPVIITRQSNFLVNSDNLQFNDINKFT